MRLRARHFLTANKSGTPLVESHKRLGSDLLAASFLHGNGGAGAAIVHYGVGGAAGVLYATLAERPTLIAKFSGAILPGDPHNTVSVECLYRRSGATLIAAKSEGPEQAVVERVPAFFTFLNCGLRTVREQGDLLCEQLIQSFQPSRAASFSAI
jgi:hypothetical protein